VRNTLLGLVMISSVASAQEKKIREYERTFQFSLFPGISTNGISSGSYYNKYSLNVFGGLTAGNRNFEIGLITNSHFKSSTGIQIAGLANILGANAFVNLTLSEERALIHDDFEVNNEGIQIAGILNYVLNHSKGIMISGGFNHVGNDFKGFQVAGIGNSTGGFSLGVHLAGFYNLAKESVAGVQISSLFNYTDGQLSGSQIGLINKARRMKGRHSTPPTKAKSLQIGLINFSREMDGTQIGLINFGGAARGKQIGLINFFQRLGSKEDVRMGTPIGLLNLGSRGSYIRLSYNEIFPANLEYTTGNCLNCTWTQSGMPYRGRNRKFNQNALIVGYDPNRDTWGFGWGFQKVLYNKASMLPVPWNEKRVITYGVKFLHLNKEMKLDRTFNLVTRLNLDWGKRYPDPKPPKKGDPRFPYWYGGISLNYFLMEPQGDEKVFDIKSPEISAGKLWGLAGKLWPGYTLGIQL
jgi:hypothetical protein